MVMLQPHLLRTQDAAQALRLLAAGARVAADLDEHIRLWDVDAVVAHFGQEQRVDLRAARWVCIRENCNSRQPCRWRCETCITRIRVHR